MAILGAAPNAALTDLEMNRVGAAAASAGSTKGHDSREEHEWRPFSSLKLRGLRAETAEIAPVLLPSSPGRRENMIESRRRPLG